MTWKTNLFIKYHYSVYSKIFKVLFLKHLYIFVYINHIRQFNTFETKAFSLSDVLTLTVINLIYILSVYNPLYLILLGFRQVQWHFCYLDESFNSSSIPFYTYLPIFNDVVNLCSVTRPMEVLFTGDSVNHNLISFPEQISISAVCIY